MSGSRLVRLARAAYPPWWRDRYGDELASLCDDLVAEGRRPARLAAGLLVGALDARVRGTGLPATGPACGQRATGALATTAVATVACVPLLAWMALSTGTSSKWTSGHRPTTAGGTRHGVVVATHLDVAGHVARWSELALLVLAAALVVRLVGAWFEVRPRRRAVPGWAPAALVAATLGLGLAYGQVDQAGWLEVAAQAALALVPASALLVAATARVPAGALVRGVRWGRRCALLCVLGAAAAVTWAVAVALQPPPPAHGSYTVTTAPAAGWCGLLAAVVLVLGALSVAGAREARRCWRASGAD